MSAPLAKRVTAPFRRKRCPECGHKVRETYCDVCGYDLIEQTRDQDLSPSGDLTAAARVRGAIHPSWHAGDHSGPEIRAG